MRARAPPATPGMSAAGGAQVTGQHRRQRHDPQHPQREQQRAVSWCLARAHVCSRCTGYRPILDAFRVFAKSDPKAYTEEAIAAAKVSEGSGCDLLSSRTSEGGRVGEAPPPRGQTASSRGRALDLRSMPAGGTVFIWGSRAGPKGSTGVERCSRVARELCRGGSACTSAGDALQGLPHGANGTTAANGHANGNGAAATTGICPSSGMPCDCRVNGGGCGGGGGGAEKANGHAGNGHAQGNGACGEGGCGKCGGAGMLPVTRPTKEPIFPFELKSKKAALLHMPGARHVRAAYVRLPPLSPAAIAAPLKSHAFGSCGRVFPPPQRADAGAEGQGRVVTVAGRVGGCGVAGPIVSWWRPATVEQLLALKAQWPAAKLVVGNTEVRLAPGVIPGAQGGCAVRAG